MTSLPIYWSEGADVALIAAGQGELPWVRGALEARYRLKPVDTLGAIDGRDPLTGIDRLMVVQPRALSPQDNLALDRWVMDGGHLFLALDRSEEHTSELQSLMRSSYAVICLKKKKQKRKRF